MKYIFDLLEYSSINVIIYLYPNMPVVNGPITSECVTSSRSLASCFLLLILFLLFNFPFAQPKHGF